jgi:PTS system mannose-specific IIB component/fructoselysine and glucoselysine-specific PTS system IIB component
LKTGILLYRVDERLIHGQVVIAWGSQLNPARYLVVDDKLANSQWEQELYGLSLPEGVPAQFVSGAGAVKSLPVWQAEETRSVLLTRDIKTMLGLAEAGLLNGVAVNLGGIHHAPGRTQVRSYIYLDDEDRQRLQRFEQWGATVYARDLPDSVKVPLPTLLKE